MLLLPTVCLLLLGTTAAAGSGVADSHGQAQLLAWQLDDTFWTEWDELAGGRLDSGYCQAVSRRRCRTYENDLQTMLDSVAAMLREGGDAVKSAAWDVQDAEERLERLQGELAGVRERSASSDSSLQWTDMLRVAQPIGSLFQLMFFNWHVHSGFVDTQWLLAEEAAYIQLFARYYALEHMRFRLGLYIGNRMSSFTFSHRSKGGTLRSGRFGFGTTSQEARFLPAAQAVLAARGVQVDDWYLHHSDSFSFYAFAWDGAAEHFKLYIMFHDVDMLPDSFVNLVKAADTAGLDLRTLPLEEHGLVSLTYHAGNGSLYEEKLYLYPSDVDDIPGKPAGASNVALMYTSRRGLVPQWDLLALNLQLSKAGKQLVSRYEAIGLALETVSYADIDNYALYFPAGSG
eukprot:PLAT6349.4.p1 GENE.PLAT6349.4~~PLAT6349.4.p1  ORF type:complete len:401 (-),score=195.90 PLAT6349.4:448-1650(-)